MTAVETGQLPVPGANLHYEIRGVGPTLLMLQGGDGDATGMADLVELLAAEFRVLTYDRRGLSRSIVLPDAPPITIALHADDAHLLLAATASEPALVFGTSLGALMGLELVSHHPQQVRRIVAHEAPATQFLPDQQREAMVQAQTQVETVFRTEGILPAMRSFAALAGLNFADREPEVALPVPKPERAANLGFFLTHDAPAVRLHRLDVERLKASADRIVVAGGSTSAHLGPGQCAEALAKLLDTRVVEFPGGHNGAMTHPKGFAARLRTVLLGSDPLVGTSG